MPPMKACLKSKVDERWINLIIFKTLEIADSYINNTSAHPNILGCIKFGTINTIETIAQEFADKYGGEVSEEDEGTHIQYPSKQKEFIMQAFIQYFGPK